MHLKAVRALFAASILTVSTVAAAAPWVRTWQAPPVEIPNAWPGHPVIPMADVTFRTAARVSAGGSSLRLRLSNELTDAPLAIGAVHVALAGPDGAPRPGTDRVVTFAGARSPTIPPFAPLTSDPVALAVPPLSKLVVSIHVPGEATRATIHSLGVETTTIVPGDQTSAATLTGGRTTKQRHILSGIDVAGGPATATIVALGDSITDGAASSDDQDRRWPDILAERLKRAGITRFAVANAGISGNRLLQTIAGPAALARLDRDVLAVPGVRYVVVLEGVNDIGWAKNAHLPPPRPEEIILAYRQIVARAHDHGVKVFGATILPYKGAGYWSQEGEAVRQEVNRWIRRPGNFDAVIDLDRAVADKADPLTMAAAYDSGDHLHPKDAGYKAMAEAIDLKLFR
jgi:lysophospholipase L1-like esterase